MPSIPAPALTEFACRLFTASGVPADDAEVVARSLVGSNLRGHDSHGVMRIPQYLGFLERGEYAVGVSLKVDRETPGLLVCDAQWGLGQVQANRLLKQILPKAEILGLAAGTMRNCGHIGRLGEYAERAAEAGMILIATVNNGGSGQRVAPPGGIEPRLGTNPLCVAVPTLLADAPIVLDFGTSVAAEGKVRVHQISGRPVPDGWLLDSQGQPTNDPSVLYRSPPGSILPLGGEQSYKGFGLALILDLLAGGLSGGECSHPAAPPVRGNNVFFLVIAPGLFAGDDRLRGQASNLADYIRATPRHSGVESILLPGDPERAMLDIRTRQGIPLDLNHWQMLVDLARNRNVPPPTLAEC
jgi:LDH2 family malate/lactate/ureidoglycolate dehydrogenase